MDEAIHLPKTWSDWEVTELIGSGSYGDVYRAVRQADDGETEEAAIKIIHLPSSESEAAALAHEYPDPQARKSYCEQLVQSLLGEIKTLQVLKDNAHTVDLQDYFVETQDADETSGALSWTIYIRMELLTPLPDYMILHQLGEAEVLRLGIDLCDALMDCSHRGILHRDIKPENIMVTSDGTFKLGDFGVARQIGLTTGSLSLKGTFTYMAPEVYHGQKYHTQADQYSLGLVLYKLLNKNRDPFIDPEARMVYYKDREHALTARMKGTPLPMPCMAGNEAGQIILKACAYEPFQRYQGYDQMKKELEWALERLEASVKMVSSTEEAGKPQEDTVIPADYGWISVKKRKKFLYSLWILPLILGGLICCDVIVPGILMAQTTDDLFKVSLLSVCLIVLAYAIPWLISRSKNCQKRFWVIFAIGVIYLTLLLIFNHSGIKDVGRVATRRMVNQLGNIFFIAYTLAYVLGALIIALIRRKSVIAQCAYRETREYKNYLAKQKARKKELSQQKKMQKRQRSLAKENAIYEKAVKQMKAEQKDDLSSRR